MTEWKMNKEWLQGILFYYFIPENCKGIITLFHGGSKDFWFLTNGGKAESWSEIHIEKKIFCNEVISRGYGVVALQSNKKIYYRLYNLLFPSIINLDIINLKKVINELKSRDLIKENYPIYSLGFSWGGAFSTKAAFGLNFNASAVYCMGPRQYSVLNPKYSIPTIWCLMENDVRIDKEKAMFYYNILGKRGVDAEFYINEQSPIYPERFWRISALHPEFTKQDSINVFNSLYEEGFIDDNFYLTFNPDVSTDWENCIPSEYISYKDEIRRQIMCSYAGHNFFNEFNNIIINFFDNH
jgi:hypothetical protein